MRFEDRPVEIDSYQNDRYKLVPAEVQYAIAPHVNFRQEQLEYCMTQMVGNLAGKLVEDAGAYKEIWEEHDVTYESDPADKLAEFMRSHWNNPIIRKCREMVHLNGLGRTWLGDFFAVRQKLVAINKYITHRKEPKFTLYLAPPGVDHVDIVRYNRGSINDYRSYNQ